MKKKNLHKAKICIFGDASNIHLKRWIDALKNRNFDVAVISYRSSTLQDVPLYDISYPELRRFEKIESFVRILRGIKMFFLLRKILNYLKPDIIHIHYLINTPLVFAFWKTKNIVLSVWGNDIVTDSRRESFFKIWYKKTLLRWAGAITATTIFLAEQTKKYVDRNISIIPFGVDTSKFNGLRHSSTDYVNITFIKHLEEKYGAKYLLEAIPLILEKNKNIRVFIAGTGSQELFLKNLTSKLLIEEYVVFLGRLEHEEVVDLLRKTHIFVMPSVWESESFGVSAIEASAMEIPVVASNLPGVREAVIDGVTGILVPPRDPQAIADACLTLINDESLRKEMGKAGRIFVKENFEWEMCVNKMINLYQRVLSNEK